MTSSPQTSSRQTSSRRTSSASRTKSASYEVGYGKPPRHAQFSKGQSGNPGGRRPGARQNWPIEPIERLKELTLREAYRGIMIKQENGVGDAAFAIQAILRSQMELALSGNARAQRDILKTVQTFERENAQALAAMLSREEVETTKQQLEDIRATWLVMREIEEAHADEEERFGAWAKHMMRRARQDYTDEDEEENEQTPEREAANGVTGVPAKEAATEERDTKRPAAAPAPPADRTLQPENGAAAAQVQKEAAASPAQKQREGQRAAKPPAAKPRAASPAKPQPPRSRRVRHVWRRRRAATPSAGTEAWGGLLSNRRLRGRTGDWAPTLGVTWNTAVSRHGPRQKSKNSLLNSLFSGNQIPVRSHEFLGWAKAAGAPRL